MNYYFDNAATSFPKMVEVAEAMSFYLNSVGGPYGRSFYKRAVDASSRVEECRDLLADFVGVTNGEKIIFTPNATVAINTVIHGIDLKGKRVLTSALEHNAVMRPLSLLKEKGEVTLEVLPSLSDGIVDVSALSKILSDDIALVVINHMSNVSGVIQPIQKIKNSIGDIPLLVDAAQSAGAVSLKLEEWGIDYCAFTGHKSLYGPTGTGALYMKKAQQVAPLFLGGTGSFSDSFDMPTVQPDRYEAGTQNIAGIFGLYAALTHRPQQLHKRDHFMELVSSLREYEQCSLICACDNSVQGELFSINIKGIDCAQCASRLYTEYKIETRTGLHCAPLAHQFYNTFPFGTVRFALSPFHTSNDLDYLLSSIKKVFLF